MSPSGTADFDWLGEALRKLDTSSLISINSFLDEVETRARARRIASFSHCCFHVRYERDGSRVVTLHDDRGDVSAAVAMSPELAQFFSQAILEHPYITDPSLAPNERYLKTNYHDSLRRRSANSSESVASRSEASLPENEIIPSSGKSGEEIA